MKNTAEKSGLHPRNRHRQRYDFSALVATHPPLGEKIAVNTWGDTSIDFADPEAVKALNQALLHHFYGVAHWTLPDGFLCPPVPGRADYLHHLADLLAEDHGNSVPTHCNLLDIGCGANCIYPLIGQAEYGWRFTGTEVSEPALRAANAIVAANPGLQRSIRLRRQKLDNAILNGVIHKNEFYHATICNPPFHASAEAAQEGSSRKQRNLGQKSSAPLNFGGQQHELWCEGGEQAFIAQMITESVDFARQCIWFTSLVSRKEHLPALRDQLREFDVAEVRIIDMAQGQKQSRFIAWSFMDKGTRAKRLTKPTA